MTSEIQKFEIVSYRDFYDLPQMFIAKSDRDIYLFECAFEDSIDDYEDFYSVYLMPKLDSINLEGSWVDLATSATRYLGKAKKSELEFDSTRRSMVMFRAESLDGMR